MMTTSLHSKILVAGIMAFLFSSPAVNAQLGAYFNKIFNDILGDDGALVPVPIILPDGTMLPDVTHRNHFKPAADAANGVLAPNLNKLIASNVSSFPLSSTSAGVRWDFSSGQPVSITESLGPIFAETGRTLGKGKVNAGMNYSYLNLDKFRGIRTQDIRFTFTHENVGSDTLGIPSTESDVIDIFLDLDVNANIFAFYATIGITDNLDVGIALPVLNIGSTCNATAVIHSFTHAHEGSANHHFGALGQESNPVLEYTRFWKASAFGIGDLALRLKYAFLPESGVNLAALVDVRLPTGKEEEFLGTGATNARFSGIVSKQFDDFTPHLNAGYEYRGAKSDSDELEFAAGFDQKIFRGLTFALDILGQIDLNAADSLTFEYSREPLVIMDQVEDKDGKTGTLTRTIDQTNIPSGINDNVFDAAIGIRYAPVENAILLANILVPLNDGGLRSSIAYTIGFSFNF